MKALEKDRSRRYETASGLARDIEQYLNDEPVEAGPPSASYRLRKLAHEHRGALLTASAFAVLLVAAVAVSSYSRRPGRSGSSAGTAASNGGRAGPASQKPWSAVSRRGGAQPRTRGRAARARRNRPGRSSPRPKPRSPRHAPKSSSTSSGKRSWRRPGPRTRKGGWASMRRSARPSTRPNRPSANRLQTSPRPKPPSARRWARATTSSASRPWRSHSFNGRSTCDARCGRRSSRYAGVAATTSAMAYQNAGKLELAATLLEEALKRRRAVLGSDDPADALIAR